MPESLFNKDAGFKNTIFNRTTLAAASVCYYAVTVISQTCWRENFNGCLRRVCYYLSSVVLETLYGYTIWECFFIFLREDNIF